MAKRLPLLGITMGDPAGVGPEITAKALTAPEVVGSCRPMVIGDRSVMEATLALLRSPLTLHAVAKPAECLFAPGTLECLDLGTWMPLPCRAPRSARERAAPPTPISKRR